MSIKWIKTEKMAGDNPWIVQPMPIGAYIIRVNKDNTMTTMATADTLAEAEDLLADLISETDTPTYHGIKQITCAVCGYTTRRQGEMECWNDMGGDCPNCITLDSFDPTDQQAIFWLTDGEVFAVRSSNNDTDGRDGDRVVIRAAHTEGA